MAREANPNALDDFDFTSLLQDRTPGWFDDRPAIAVDGSEDRSIFADPRDEVTLSPFEADEAVVREANPSPPDDFDFEILLQDWMPGWFDDLPDIQVSVDGKYKEIDLPGDRMIFTGPGQEVTLTNLETDESVTFGITGSFHQETDEDGNVTTWSKGRSLLGDPYVDDGDPGLVLAIGNWGWTFDEDGNLVESLHGRGQLTNVLDEIL